MVDVQTIGLALQTVSVMSVATAAVVGVRSYIASNKRVEEAKKKEQETREMELKAQQQTLETRQAQMFLNIYDQTKSQEYISAFNKVVLDSRWENFADYQKVMKNKRFRDLDYVLEMFYEGLGALVRENLINVRMVALLLSGNIQLYWKKYEPIVEDVRRYSGHRRWFSA